MNSVLRRAGKKQAETTINYQDLSINTIAARVFKNNQEVFLTGMEYRLLLILATHRNQVMKMCIRDRPLTEGVAQVGFYACSPKNSTFDAEFFDMMIESLQWEEKRNKL